MAASVGVVFLSPVKISFQTIALCAECYYGLSSPGSDDGFILLEKWSR